MHFRSLGCLALLLTGAPAVAETYVGGEFIADRATLDEGGNPASGFVYGQRRGDAGFYGLGDRELSFALLPGTVEHDALGAAPGGEETEYQRLVFRQGMSAQAGRSLVHLRAGYLLMLDRHESATR